MIFNIFLLSLLILCFAQIQHTPIEPRIVPVKLRPLVKTIPSKHIFKTSYPNFGYEISGKVYQTNKQLLNEQLHDNKKYNNSSSCVFYNSQLSLEQINDLQLKDGYSIQSYYLWSSQRSIFLIISNRSFSQQDKQYKRLLIKYEFDQRQIKDSIFNISVSQLGLKDDINNNILMNRIQNTLIITDGIKMIGFDSKTLKKWQIKINNQFVDYQFASSDSLLQFQIATMDYQNKKIKIAILWKSVLKIYQLTQDLTQSTLVQTFKPPTGKYYTSAVIDVNYYTLVQKQLIITRLQKDGNYQTDYIDLESQECWQLSKQQSTIHMICKEGGLNYVAQLYYNQSFSKVDEALKLNRYYTEIDDAKLIFRFGNWENPKLLIAGDNDLLLTAFAINRKILVESERYQSMTRLKSFGIQDIETVQDFSPSNITFSVGIGSNSIFIFKIIQEPSFIECILQRKENNLRWNLLVQINSTSCLANGDIEQLESICQTLIPYSLYVSLFQIDSNKELTANLFIYIILFVIGIFIVGCAFHCKKLITKGKSEIKKKIDALKRKKEMKPI